MACTCPHCGTPLEVTELVVVTKRAQWQQAVDDALLHEAQHQAPDAEQQAAAPR
jgi:hypothetical protein